MVFRLGRYYFDKAPFVGRMAGMAAWSSLLTEEQMQVWTSCRPAVLAPGVLISTSTSWRSTGGLVTQTSVDMEELQCSKYKDLTSAHLPIPELGWDEAEELCNKFGSDVTMAGEISSLEDYDMYYAGVTNNSWYSEVCGYSDNGRLKTWLPYVVNSTGTGLVHVRSGTPLFGPFYASWYPGPQGPSPTDVGAAYYGLVPKYENVVGDKPTARKCTACALHDSHVKTSTVTLRGVCRYSSLDTRYQVQYTPELGIAYYGEERTSITYSRELSVWQIADMSDPTITAVSEAPFRSLALGISTWTVHNDTGCSPDSLVTRLALTSCGVDEFTCWDGVCLPLAQRCDGRPQCRDSTDEISCSVLDINPSYNRC